MLDLVACELELLTHLRAAMGGVPARAYPATNRDGDLPALMNESGEIYVRWLGDVLPAPSPNRSQVVEQQVTAQWETLVRCKSHAAASANPHQRGYDLVKALNDVLIGYTVAAASDATVMYPIRRQFIGEIEGIWAFTIIWQFVHLEADALVSQEGA